MLNLVLSAIAIIGVLILLHTAIANNKNFLYVMLLVKPFIDITVNVTLIGSLNGLELSGMLIFIAILILTALICMIIGPMAKANQL